MKKISVILGFLVLSVSSVSGAEEKVQFNSLIRLENSREAVDLACKVGPKVSEFPFWIHCNSEWAERMARRECLQKDMVDRNNCISSTLFETADEILFYPLH